MKQITADSDPVLFNFASNVSKWKSGALFRVPPFRSETLAVRPAPIENLSVCASSAWGEPDPVYSTIPASELR
jgi:hypothetical protein